MRYLRIDGNTVLDDREAHIAEFNRPGSGERLCVLGVVLGGRGGVLGVLVWGV